MVASGSCNRALSGRYGLPFPSRSLNLGRPKIFAVSINAATVSGLLKDVADPPLGDICSGMRVMRMRALVSIWCNWALD